MKQGQAMAQVAAQLKAIKESSRDFIVPTEKISMEVDGTLEFGDAEQQHFFPPTDHCHAQISGYTGVPKTFYDRLKEENVPLLSQNVNHCLEVLGKERPRGRLESRMLRTAEGKARALVSAAYRRLDSYDLVNEIFPILLKNKMGVISCELTETRLYIKALHPELTTELRKGDPVQYGLVLSNSDVGSGAVNVHPMIYRLAGQRAFVAPSMIRKFHIGKSQAEDDYYELLSDNTRDMTDAAFWASVRDVVLGSIRAEVFQKEVDRLRAALGDPIKNYDLIRVVELTTRSLGLTATEDVKKDMVALLAAGEGGSGLTRLGLASAIAGAGEKLGYDAATDLERAAHRALDLGGNDWKAIAASS